MKLIVQFGSNPGLWFGKPTRQVHLVDEYIFIRVWRGFAVTFGRFLFGRFIGWLPAVSTRWYSDE
jgi:hypothetical protein